MKEYTLAALLATAAVVLLDRQLNTNILRRSTYWVFMVVMVLFTTIVNGYLTWRPIVVYGEAHTLGLRLSSIPVEDYLYGFALITLTVVIWEYFRGREKQERSGA